jgi:hypothetical protein
MVYGVVNTDYIVFLIKDDEETVREKAEELEISIRIEAKLRERMIFEDDVWDF